MLLALRNMTSGSVPEVADSDFGNSTGRAMPLNPCWMAAPCNRKLLLWGVFPTCQIQAPLWVWKPHSGTWSLEVCRSSPTPNVEMCCGANPLLEAIHVEMAFPLAQDNPWSRSLSPSSPRATYSRQALEQVSLPGQSHSYLLSACP